MPTEKPRFTITMDSDLFDAINDYKFTHRIKNQTQAVIELIERGMENISSPNSNNQIVTFSSPSVLAPDEAAKKYRALDEHGKRIVSYILNEEYSRISTKFKIAGRNEGMQDIETDATPDEITELLSQLSDDI